MGQVLVRSHHQVAAIGQGREARWTARQHGKTVALEFQVSNDFRPEKAVDVAGGRNLEARPKLLSHDAAPDKFAAFQDQDFSSGPSQISSRDQAVMPGTD